MPYRLSIDDGRFSQTLEVRSGRLSVGTSSACRLRLTSNGVALRHAAFRMEDGRVLVEDLSGGPGITVDGRSVARASLEPGSLVGIGSATIRVLEVGALLRPGPQLPKSRSRDVLGAARTPLRERFLRGPVVASAVLHLAALLLLRHVALSDRVPQAPEVEFSFAAQDAAPEVPPEVSAPELETPSEWREPPPEARPDDPPLSDADDFFSVPLRDLPPDAPVLAAVNERVPETAPQAPIGVGAAPVVPATSFGKDGAGRANAQASDLLGSDPGAGAVLQGVRGRAGSARVWVVRGDYDQAERVLEGLGIEHLVITRDDLEGVEIPATVRALLFNCTGKPLTDDAAARVAAWVGAGGWLLSTDWGLDRVVTRGFPGRLTILHAGIGKSLTADETIGARADGAHPFLAGVPTDGTFRWWLEDSSVPFRAGDGAEVLVRSEDLDRRNGSDAVAAAFVHGRGTVLHLLGHVFQQEGTLRGAYAMQRLVVNFLDGALRD